MSNCSNSNWVVTTDTSATTMSSSGNSKSVATTSAITQHQSSGWHPGFRQTPWSALVLILIMLACMGACAGIIAGSDNHPVTSWNISPAVFLAVLSAIWSYSLGGVLAISVAISWWRSATRGTTLESLHYIWTQGVGLNPVSALRSSAAARKAFVLAWIVLSVQIANNPLLQRATHTSAKNVIIDDYKTLDIVQQLPDGWLGSIQDASTATIIGSRHGLATVQKWWMNQTIFISGSNATGSQCFDRCEGNARGSGIDYTCTWTTMGLDLSAKESIGAVLFGINTTMSTDSSGAPILLLTTLFSSTIDDTCIATLNITTCTIEAAVVEYPIVMQNATVSLNQEKLSRPAVISKYISNGDLPTANKGNGAGPLVGLNDFFGSYLAANVTLLIDKSRNVSLYSGGFIADLFFIPDGYDDTVFHKCGLTWHSPTEYVLTSMHDFLFRSSINASTDADTQVFPVRRTSLSLVFQSNYNYLAAALAAMLFALFAVLFQLWGWWELGRKVSLSPLELARAFGAPTVPLTNETVAARSILKQVGKCQIRYDGDSFHMSAITSRGAAEIRDSRESEE